MKIMTEHRALALPLVSALVGVVLGACSGPGFEYSYPESSRTVTEGTRYSGDPPEKTILGEGGLDFTLFGDDGKSRGGGGGGAGIGVNSFLWRATLDTISFMPLSSADPFGGVIITDWYTPPEAPGERFKMNVYILGRELRADGLRVAVFRQERGNGGAWVDSAIAKDTSTNLENKILARARQLRVVAAEN